MTRHFLDLSDFSATELRAILHAGEQIKSRRRTPGAAADRLLEGKVIAMIFEQPSLRTRVSFDVGIRELGGSPMMVTGQEIELGERETIADTARVLSRYVDAIMIRMLDHDSVVEMAKYATVPVINGLTKRQHPCQVMADVMTFEERKGPIKGKRIAWTGDSNNVLTSWVHAAGRLDFELAIATPEELSPPPALLDWARSQGAKLSLTTRPEAAVEGADCVITDCWVSMGDVEGTRHNLLRPYQVDERLLGRAEKDAIFMHCLPACRGEEVTDGVMDGPQSAVFDEAENRLHAQKGILAWCFGGGRGLMAETDTGAGLAALDDRVVPFTVPDLDVRGRVVRLGASIDTILGRHDYPEAVARVLGEAAALTVLLGTALKFEGRFQLQTKSDGPISMMVVDFNAPDVYRAVAHFDQAKLDEAIGAGALSTGDLLGEGHLAMTVDQGSATTRYQGVVPLVRQSLEEAAHQYFRQSEQIPSRIRLGVGAIVTAGGGRQWRAGGLLVQFMPHSVDRLRAADLHPGDAPQGHEIMAHDDPDGISDDAWAEARSLVETVEDHELLDPLLESERLLYRLFHERGARVFEAMLVHEDCRCSRERVLGMLRGFSGDDRKAMVADDGTLGVTCEFCSRRYEFTPDEVEDGLAAE